MRSFWELIPSGGDDGTGDINDPMDDLSNQDDSETD